LCKRLHTELRAGVRVHTSAISMRANSPRRFER
jgi:hypothetical protein